MIGEVLRILKEKMAHNNDIGVAYPAAPGRIETTRPIHVIAAHSDQESESAEHIHLAADAFAQPAAPLAEPIGVPAAPAAEGFPVTLDTLHRDLVSLIDETRSGFRQLIVIMLRQEQRQEVAQQRQEHQQQQLAQAVRDLGRRPCCVIL